MLIMKAFPGPGLRLTYRPVLDLEALSVMVVGVEVEQGHLKGKYT